eukprot:1160622-Pelagomonas_calceolata.AAC.2
MQIDQEVYSQLMQTGEFEMMDVDTDEVGHRWLWNSLKTAGTRKGELVVSVQGAEHSLELHTPYIVHTMGSKSFSLVPIMVGALSTSREAGVAGVVHEWIMLNKSEGRALGSREIFDGYVDEGCEKDQCAGETGMHKQSPAKLARS